MSDKFNCAKQISSLVTSLISSFRESILFLIGVQELSQGIRKFDKEEKTYLLHIAVCKLLSNYGYYKFKHIDEDGWPHWEETKKLESLSELDQETLIKKSIIEYFKDY